MALYTPDELLPIYPTYTTVVKDGIKYKAYLETDWHQVITEDGIPLCKLLQSMPQYSSTDFYKYKGIYKDTPSLTAIEQLYATINQGVGDVYLVETDRVSDGIVDEAYVWLGNDAGWVYCGTTNRKASLYKDLPNMVRLFPDKIGEPDQILVVGKDGKSITWGESSVNTHNEDELAHPDIREKIDLKADKLIIFNDTLSIDEWFYDSTYPSFAYIYTNDKIPPNSYFEITPIVNKPEEAYNVSDAGIIPVYQINCVDDNPSYTILRSRRVPGENINICVKVFGTYIDEH